MTEEHPHEDRAGQDLLRQHPALDEVVRRLVEAYHPLRPAAPSLPATAPRLAGSSAWAVGQPFAANGFLAAAGRRGYTPS